MTGGWRFDREEERKKRRKEEDPFTWPAARRRVLRSRGNEKNGPPEEEEEEEEEEEKNPVKPSIVIDIIGEPAKSLKQHPTLRYSSSRRETGHEIVSLAMDKLPIIPRSGIIHSNADHQKERQERATTTTTTTVAAAAAVVVGGADARCSTTSGAIADNAAADRRFLIASARGEEYTRRRSGIVDTSQPISSARSDLIARRRRRDVLAAIARPRRNTWHAENKDDAVRVTDRDPSESPRIDVIDDYTERGCALDATDSAGFWNVRTADDDRRTCCVSIDAATFLARRGPARDRIIRDLTVERRNRRAGSTLLTRSRSVAGGEEIFRSTVNSITIGRENRFFETPLVGTTDFPKCNGRTLSSNTSSIVLHEVNGGLSTTVREIGSLGDDELEIIRRSIVQGLGLQRIPDPSKVGLVDIALARIQSIVYY
ncbi:hypothetical protein ALC60_10500 [Trachymyrmex zeteki]|uniref:Uncharacterized protein n=1 Tax=Mycetomoellerius zeteki TaxID=64791 RepID=A0A151WRE8_9HYME|nr:hypothetical protein ALC60_10500 [Trachymyrmex zeteki]